MGAIISGVIGLSILFAIFKFIGMRGVLALLIGGGIGYAIGETKSDGWSIFGALSGGLVAVYVLNKKKFDSLSD